jgi:hypothetical protein
MDTIKSSYIQFADSRALAFNHKSPRTAVAHSHLSERAYLDDGIWRTAADLSLIPLL